MSRRKSSVTVVVCGLLVAVCLGSGISPAVAADSDREDRWQFYVPITYTSSERIDGEGGTFIDLGSDLGWGFAFGYNFNERLMLGLEITWSQKNYSARIVGDTTPPDIVDINSRLDSSTIAVVGQFNFLDKAFTPFVRAGLGSTYIDSNVASAPPQGTCWWHPWLGYICDTWQPTYDRNSFSYQAGVGLRADVNDAFWLELSYGTLWIDLSHGSTPDISGPRLNIGWLF